MTIIKDTPESNGAYASQNWEGDTAPEGYIAIPDEFFPHWEQYKPFVTLTIVDGVIISIDDNATARMTATTPTLNVMRSAALARIDGKCSAVISSGIAVNGKHYSLSDHDQTNLNAAVNKANAGETQIPFSADGEALTNYTPEEIRSVGDTAYKWLLANREYNGQLVKWIKRETDAAILPTIDYGKVLPSDLTVVLAAQLTAAGIDTASFAALLTA